MNENLRKQMEEMAHKYKHARWADGEPHTQYLVDIKFAFEAGFAACSEIYEAKLERAKDKLIRVAVSEGCGDRSDLAQVGYLMSVAREVIKELE